MILGNNSSVDALLQKRKERFVCLSNLSFAESYVLFVSYVIKMSKNGLDYKNMIKFRIYQFCFNKFDVL